MTKDEEKLIAPNWRKSELREEKRIRSLYLEQVNQNLQLRNLIIKLGGIPEELNNLLFIVNAFVPALIWDLNIHSDKELVAELFRSVHQFEWLEIHREFNCILLLVGAADKSQLDVTRIDRLYKAYLQFLNSINPFDFTIASKEIDFFVEEKEAYLKKYGNLKNFLN